MKDCKICKQTLSLEQFSKASKSTYSSYCKQCKRNKNKNNYNSELKKQYYQNNKEHKKQYYLDTKEQHIGRANKWVINNSEKASQMWKKYYQDNKEKKNEYIKTRYKNDPSFKIISLLRSRILQVLKNKKQDKSINFLGCSPKEFKLYLEQQFQPEMSWDNHGKIWEIDHIVPINKGGSFNYKNTQPLFKTTKIAEDLGYKNYIGNKNKEKGRYGKTRTT
jgi:hypothetical protein